ncbi:MAG: PhzF family phenazine biosynthesis protein [Boseongicola sp.]|nr:PhzF family phenazine biosynthesis protein [Boseongicola sp.]MDD9976869.1 PhzF family phenazine biosynthesis protein [Boseongicola sp.]
MTNYVVYDVFTSEAFGGNPLAVVLDANGLTEKDMRNIAREFNFSETTFVFPPDDPNHTAKVRIFTPAWELPFAGHPTVGTALALYDLGLAGDDMTLELKVGPIPVTIEGRTARFETRVPLTIEEAPDTAALAACIGQTASAIRVSNHEPVLAGVGTPFVLAELESDAALAEAAPNTDAFLQAAGGEVGRLGLFVYRRDGHSIRARMFAPLGGIPEDPATGSAVAGLVAFLGRLEGQSGTFDIRQGVEMGRPSRITAEVVVEDGDPVCVAISGEAVKVMEGRLTV